MSTGMFEGSRESSALLRPAFLVGCVRSGTTLLRLMLDHHPRITFMFESEFMVDMIGPEGEMPDLEQYMEFLKSHRIFNLSGLKLPETRNVPELLNDFLRQRLAEKPMAEVIGATIHHRFDRVPFVWPNAKYIHLIRDGRDVSRSVIQMGWAGNNWYGMQRWLEAEETWQRLKPRIEADQYIELSYENLVSNAEYELIRLCEFLGVCFDPVMFDYRNTSNYGMPDPSLAEQWRRKQRPEEIQLAEACGGKMLIDLGYKLSGHSPITVGGLRERALRLHNWWSRARFRMNRYGLRLFFADYFARRIGTKSMRRSSRLRMDAVDKEHLQ
jgi:hypothetical protein